MNELNNKRYDKRCFCKIGTAVLFLCTSLSAAAQDTAFQLLANAVLILHFGVVLFVIGGLFLIFIGNGRGWQWVNLLWFRLVHLATILYVAGQALLNVTCPLTTLENWLRHKGGNTGYSSGFIEYWFHKILFYNGPPWAFTLAYTAFACLVALSWWRFPPKRTIK